VSLALLFFDQGFSHKLFEKSITLDLHQFFLELSNGAFEHQDLLTSAVFMALVLARSGTHEPLSNAGVQFLLRCLFLDDVKINTTVDKSSRSIYNSIIKKLQGLRLGHLIVEDRPCPMLMALYCLQSLARSKEGARGLLTLYLVN
jgi:hypothetical protein